MFQTGKVNSRICFTIWVFASLFLFLEAGFAEEPASHVVRVIGTAAVHGDNAARAREQAISKGLVAAVDAVILELIPPERLVEDFPLSNEIIYDHTDTFIQHYKVLAETKYQNTYRVVVQATISMETLQQRLSEAGIALNQSSLPRVLLLISELNLDSMSPRFWWDENMLFFRAASETAIAEVLTNQGYTVIDPQITLQPPDVAPIAPRPDITAQDAVDMGHRYGADVVVVGQSHVERTENIMGANTRSFNGSISAKVIRTDNGEEIAETSQSAVTVNTNELAGSREALITAGILAGEALAEGMAAIWQKGPEPPASVRVSVSGTHNLGNFVLFRKILNDISGVKRLKLEEMKADTSTIVVDYSGSPRSLADSLMMERYETFSINITEVTEDHLRIELVSK